jgi:hypothetical protein
MNKIIKMLQDINNFYDFGELNKIKPYQKQGYDMLDVHSVGMNSTHDFYPSKIDRRKI